VRGPCGDTGPHASAGFTSVHGFGGFGGRKRFAPPVVSPYGIPLKTKTPFRVKPRTFPRSWRRRRGRGWRLGFAGLAVWGPRMRCRVSRTPQSRGAGDAALFRNVAAVDEDVLDGHGDSRSMRA
jgi:hypothetical protein